MDYEWDPDKASSNLRKHGVSFADAVGVFEDENALTIQDENPVEDRFITIGTISWTAYWSSFTPFVALLYGSFQQGKPLHVKERYIRNKNEEGI